MIHDQSNNNMCQRETTLLNRNTTTPFKAAGNYYCVSPNVFGGVKMIEFRSNQKNTSDKFVFQLLPSCALQCFFACLFHRRGRFRGRFGGRSSNHRRYGGQRYRRRGGQNHRRRCGQWWGRWKSGSRMSILALARCDAFCAFAAVPGKPYESTMFLGNWIAGFRKLTATCFPGQ